MSRFLKLGAISAIVFFLLFYGMSLLIPSTVRVSRAINIEAPRDSILPTLSDMRKWGNWNDLANDSIDVQVLAVSPDRIITSWSSHERHISSGFTMTESSGITVVQWYFDFKLKWYPWEKFGSIIFDKQFGMPMESSLNKLKKVIEKSP